MPTFVESVFPKRKRMLGVANSLYGSVLPNNMIVKNRQFLSLTKFAVFTSLAEKFQDSHT